jgi:hypothetical protein
MAPFFLLASGLVYLRKNNNLMSLLILLCGVVLEAAQMIWVDSRSALIMLIVALLTSLLPLNIYGKIWRFLGRYVPFLYLILLIWLLIGFASGEFYVNPTASNIERSALAFWSYKMMPDYIFSGPGADEFFKNVNDALISVERGRDDDGIDPHSFLLSYWVGLGVLPMIAIYSVWWKLFEKINRASQIESFYKRISFSYFATYAVISFTLAAPDSFFRMVVGIALGVVISNTHDH